jgi:hypothetical protein
MFLVNGMYVAGICVYKTINASKRERNTFRELS